MKKLTRLIAPLAFAACVLPAIAGPVFSGPDREIPLADRHGDATVAAVPAPRDSAIKAGWGVEPERTTIAEPGVLLLLGAGLLAAGIARK